MYYFLVFALLLVLELIYFHIADRFNIIDKPNERSSHTRVTLRGGGIIFYLGALLYFLADHFEYPWFMAGLTLITIVSFIDDIHSVSKRVRLAIHFTAMLLLFYQWGGTALPWWYIPIALIFCTGLINAYNFMDGINGITGGYSLVVTGTLLYINEYQVNFIEAQLLWVMVIAITVFNIFNFRKKAKCFAGDVGSVSIAFIILFLLGKLIIQTRDLGYIILLAVYGVDSILTIIHRLLLHENISLPHRKHLYQIMANELKIPHVAVSGFYMLLQSIISIGYIYCEAYKSWYFISIILILSFGYIWFMRKYFGLHSITQ
ncbi:MraY family glycosyltransferase [Gabonibacter massiliensis]|uniref:MraY family glycosyltransferase n=1 Tax=Gabonibacter massiliensis TaxID=1720195 RepID=UPI00073F39CA|nr:glycosyltransferase family 4 protein [Gabonibacter massiliensis]